MRVIRDGERTGARVIALGTFDGVHRGHAALLEKGREYAEKHGILLQACTFDRHPLEVLFPERAPKLLNTLPEKLRRMAACGADEVRILRFEKRTAETAPEEFLRMLRETSQPRAVTAGWNYTFGRGGEGNAELLLEDGKKHGYEVLIVPPVKTEDGTVISSSEVRGLLAQGNITRANELLGSEYSLTGTVVNGKQMGSRIGFPTANVRVPERKLLPAYGVYICAAETDRELWPAVVNIGVQPTLPSGGVTVEAHILTDSPELYGRKLRITLKERLRGEKRFGSVEELQAQIAADREAAIRFFGL